jgi:hypothetical protein
MIAPAQIDDKAQHALLLLSAVPLLYSLDHRPSGKRAAYTCTPGEASDAEREGKLAAGLGVIRTRARGRDGLMCAAFGEIVASRLDLDQIVTWHGRSLSSDAIESHG